MGPHGTCLRQSKLFAQYVASSYERTHHQACGDMEGTAARTQGTRETTSLGALQRALTVLQKKGKRDRARAFTYDISAPYFHSAPSSWSGQRVARMRRTRSSMSWVGTASLVRRGTAIPNSESGPPGPGRPPARVSRRRDLGRGPPGPGREYTACARGGQLVPAGLLQSGSLAGRLEGATGLGGARPCESRVASDGSIAA